MFVFVNQEEAKPARLKMSSCHYWIIFSLVVKGDPDNIPHQMEVYDDIFQKNIPALVTVINPFALDVERLATLEASVRPRTTRIADRSDKKIWIVGVGTPPR